MYNRSQSISKWHVGEQLAHLVGSTGEQAETPVAGLLTHFREQPCFAYAHLATHKQSARTIGSFKLNGIEQVTKELHLALTSDERERRREPLDARERISKWCLHAALPPLSRLFPRLIHRAASRPFRHARRNIVIDEQTVIDQQKGDIDDKIYPE
jgi:hypothetical protein